MKFIIVIVSINLYLNISFAAPKLHVILTADSDATDIGKAVSVDKRNMNKLFAGIADHFDDSDIYSLSAGSLSENSIKNKVEAMNIGTDDILVFYYSGHGDRSNYKESPWPRLTPANNQSIEVRDILNELNKHMSRQVIVIIDACNGEFYEDISGNRWPASDFNEISINKLFKKFRGNIVITSSKPGLVSYTLKNDLGSLLTYEFVNVLKYELGNPNTNWDDILSQTKNKVVANDTASVQTPRYSLTKQ